MQLEERFGATESAPQSGIAVVQVAIVVRELEKSLRHYCKVLGWNPWRVYDFRTLDHVDTRVRGEPSSYAMRTAICRVGNVDFEVIEPLGPSPYTEFLETRGEGLHHIQIRGKDPQALRERLANSGVPFLMGGQVRLGPDAALEYAYHDGTDELHLFIESTFGDRERLLNLKPVIFDAA